MLLPIEVCVPAPGQGALLAEANPNHPKAVELLRSINHSTHFDNCMFEKKQALQYGKGCNQRFGLTTIHYDGKTAWLAAGIKNDGEKFEHWYGLPEKPHRDMQVFNAVKYMKSFSEFYAPEQVPAFAKEVVFVASKNAFQQKELQQQLKQKQVWAAGTHTWYALAAAGIWVNGCADGMGLQQLLHTWQMPLLQVKQDDVVVLTHELAAGYWQQKGWQTLATYKSEPKTLMHLADAIATANFFFWTNAMQYRQARQYIKHPDAIHACPSGATAEQLRELGLNPLVFPTIQSFKVWSKQHIL